MCPSTTGVTKLSSAVESFERLGVEGSLCRGGKGWWVDGKEGCGEGTSAANRLCESTDYRFEEGVALQTSAFSGTPPGKARKSRGGEGVTDPHLMAWGGTCMRLTI